MFELFQYASIDDERGYDAADAKVKKEGFSGFSKKWIRELLKAVFVISFGELLLKDCISERKRRLKFR